MATIKSYTDLSQSKTLSKILPLESADMRFCFSHTLDGRITGHYPMIGREPSLGTIPCWSLVALLDVLPYKFVYNHYLTLYKEGSKEYCCCCEDVNGNGFAYNFADNPIDVCYEMILKLYELKML